MPEGTQEAEKAQEQASHSIFDAPGSASSVQDTPTAEAAANAAAAEKGADASLFSESLFQEGTEQQNNNPDADVIAKLQASGYKVEKSEVVDEDEKIKKQLEFHDGNIRQAEEFIKKDDKSIVLEKIRNDKADKYTATGRQHLIGSEDFDIECEAEMDADYENPSFLKMQADQIRQLIKANVIERNAGEKNKIVGDIEAKTKTEILEKQKKLDATFDTIFKDGFMGTKFDKQVIIDTRNKVINGEFTKDIKNNPEILAELALVYYQKQALLEKAGGSSYGEGVAAAFHALNGDDKAKGPTSSMSAAKQIEASGQQGVFDLNKWLNTAEDSDKDKKVI